jgi:hypothetical protein
MHELSIQRQTTNRCLIFLINCVIEYVPNERKLLCCLLLASSLFRDIFARYEKERERETQTD